MQRIGIKVAGDPDFNDLGPPPERIRLRFEGSNSLPHDLVSAAVDVAPMYIRNGGSIKGCISKIAERLPSATKAELKILEEGIRLEAFRASKLHDLRRMKDAGITHCILKSCRDERNTVTENELEGKRMTLLQARKLVDKYGDEIARSHFAGEVKF
ncbi:hypothetical protein GCM10023069_54760 [Shinella granuli]